MKPGHGTGLLATPRCCLGHDRGDEQQAEDRAREPRARVSGRQEHVKIQLRFQLNHRCGRALDCLMLGHGHSKDAREAEYLREAENLLDLLQLVARHDDLVSGHEVERVWGATFVDGGHVNGELG